MSNFEEWFLSNGIPLDTDFNVAKRAFEAGQQSQQAKIDELQARVPEGYVVVPVDPTEDMIMAGCMEHGGYDVIDSKSIYKAMINSI